MKTVPIQAEPRERIGKGSARSTRRDGRIPGVLYGQGETIPISIDRKEFVKAMVEAHGENVIFDLAVTGRKPMIAIAREVQHDPISRNAIHVDFLHISMTHKINVKVPVRLVGTPEGVKNFGGILEHGARELEVLCLPAEIPSHIDVDVSALMIGESIHVSEIARGSFEILGEGSKVVAHVAAPSVEKIAEPEAEVVLPEGEEAAAGEAAAAKEGEAKAEGGAKAKEGGPKAKEGGAKAKEGGPKKGDGGQKS
jgi:large subunit ribosomal protein L25